MASPITWRNVDAPSNVGVSQLFNGAQNGINSGFDHIGEVLKQREQMDQTNWNQQKTNNTQAFMDALGEAKTPEEFQAKQAFLANMRNSMGAQIDAPAARAAEDARLGILQNRAVTNNTFNASMDAEHDRPIQDQISEAIYNNDPVKALALKEQLKRGLGDVAKNIDARQEQLLGRDRAGKEFSFKEKDAQYKAEDQDMEKKLFPLKEAQLQASINASNASAALQNANRTRLRRELDADGNPTKKIQTAIEAFKPTSHFSDGIVGTKEGDAAVEKAIKEAASNPAEARDIRYNLQKFMANRSPDSGPVPASAVIASIGIATPNPIEGMVPGWSRRGDDMAANLNDYLDKHKDTIQGDFNTLNELNLRLVSRGVGKSTTTKEQASATAVPPTEVQIPTKQAVEPPPVPVTPKSTEADTTRAKLKAEFVAAQKAVRDAGGIDVAPVAQLDTLKRITKALRELDVDTSTMTAKARKELSEQRRIADQEEALKKLLGR